MEITQQTSKMGLLLFFLYAALFNIVANLDYKGLMDYGLKAVLGGLIWLVFKMIADRSVKEKKATNKPDFDHEA